MHRLVAHAVTYQVYHPVVRRCRRRRSRCVEVMRSRLPYLAALGVDAVWVNPWSLRRSVDGGYDVADYRDIDRRSAPRTRRSASSTCPRTDPGDPRQSSPTTSDKHEWFAAALAAGPGSPSAPLHIQARQGADAHCRRTTGGHVRWNGLDAGDRTEREPGSGSSTCRRRATRSQLGPPEWRRVPRHPRVLVRTWRRTASGSTSPTG